jgi:hypothetical protein
MSLLWDGMGRLTSRRTVPRIPSFLSVFPFEWRSTTRRDKVFGGCFLHGDGVGVVTNTLWHNSASMSGS